MLFNSFSFFVFFPCVFLGILIVPKKLRCFWLFLASLVYYLSWGPGMIVYIAFTSLTTYGSGRMISYLTRQKHPKEQMGKRIILILCLLINFGILGFFKYVGFLTENLNQLLQAMGIAPVKAFSSLAMPVGISFYTFQTVGYLIDVYRGDVEAEKNVLIYALFSFFFPSVVSGPIGRAGELLPQFRSLKEKKLWNWDRIFRGMVLMLWGFFLKLVIADRIALFVNEVFDEYWLYGTVELVLAAISYSIQLYCDFASYSLMALGAAQILGITLIDNFDVPYFAKSIPEFWRRWHISLSSWLRDYIYIPLGGSRCSALRNRLNILITFLVSGIWHGANWTYLVWGGLHGLYQIVGKTLKPLRQRMYRFFGICEDWTGVGIFKIFITFLLTTAAWIFFRAESLKAGVDFLCRIFTKWNPEVLFDQSWKYLGLDPKEWGVLTAAIVILFLVDAVRYFKKLRIDVFVSRQCLVIRWALVYLLLFMVLLYGVYGQGYDASQFIYFQF